MRPFIGVTSSAETDGTPVARPAYARAVTLAGGLPVALPWIEDQDEALGLLQRLSGVVLTGSEDLHPSLWGEPLHPAVTLMHEHRQRTELCLSKALLGCELPLLAICGGMQNLAVAAGSRVHQHLPDLGEHVLDHAVGVDAAPHPLQAEPGSLLARALGERCLVNSAHHQGMASLGPGLVPVGHAPDGVLEAWELSDRRFGLGVQWHPERMPDDPGQQGLFRLLVAAAQA
ncbi:MAG: gamma-glutamyl-gamma-aminobutyrate hydrolase family protein [Planctomycetota bacterium]|nr:MAG: gamma-glutamyl-gamma-aminobutyrate hydrolase family protein [Planctomycetota bacterium]